MDRQQTRGTMRGRWGALGLRVLLALMCSSILSAYGDRARDAPAAGRAHAAGVAQDAPVPPLAALDALIGRWHGTSEGKPGAGTVEREYSRVLRSRFVKVRNVSTYPPQEKNPKGETHEDVGFFSFDQTRKRLVFRQFHVEGFVNQYVADLSPTSGVLVFTSEAIENIPAGWRARETYVVSGSGQMEERFELAEPGKEFELYSRTRLTRIQQVVDGLSR